MTEQVTGVILAGGKSSRMGRDKATLEVEGVALFERVLGVFQRIFSDILIAGERPDLARPGVCCHPDIYPGSALGGLYTGLFEADSDWIFVAPCDLPFPDPNLIKALLRLRDGYDVVLPRTGQGLDPLFACYRKSCLEPMRRLLDNRRYRIFDFYDQVRVRYVDEHELPEGWRQALLNVNTPEEFQDLEDLLPKP
ncbi:molybdenum cofactor guanylyltransferase [Desulfuromonas versatilis]|uniref:molybdenum cofactor guanylyltransferase n=1 Tax=Desulfuromonas versatilis TaxID=2802975 RepID=UPI001CEC474D|nr:molybdenum cofactor guanylyltransferase [Desulfuromonas versatilis]